MYLPKSIVFILFFLALSSTGGLIFVLGQQSGEEKVLESPNADTVVVSATPSSVDDGETAAVESKDESEEEVLMASAQWQKYEADSLDLELEYPEEWSAGVSDDVLVIGSNDEENMVNVRVARTKKPSRSQKISEYIEERKTALKDEDFEVDADMAYEIDGYDAIGINYKKEEQSNREIMFLTRNYVYTVIIENIGEEIEPVIEELVRSIDIV
jgi:hypothetical protein